jgi:esterase/lipase superfamily enzyme
MPAPNLYTQPGAPPLFNNLPESLKTSRAELVYVTDRKPEQDESGNLIYGYGRSQSIAFGTVTVAIEPDSSWAELERASLDPDRGKDLTLRVVNIEEQHRFPRTPLPAVVTGNSIEIDPDALGMVEESEQALRQFLAARLAESPRKEVLLFVHGFNNHFEDAAETLAELWHFLGRDIVPIVYTWPAGRGGASGYIYDRESGEFTVFHLKNLIDFLGRIEEIEKVHLMAHSRGTDVLTSAVRELMIQTRAEGRDPIEAYRVENLVLAAPDLDMDVVSQRIIAEYLGTTIEYITVYTSQGDRAVSMAERFFRSRGRIGTMSPEDLAAADRTLLSEIEGTSFIEYTGRTDSTGHGYFHSSPAVSSDIVLTLRYGKQPGAEHGRPLRNVAPLFWQVEPGYPGARTSQP